MARNDDAVLTAARGLVFLAPKDTAAPADAVITASPFDPTALDPAWVPVGHTSRDELPEFGFEGGDTETRGSWQVQVLREVVTDPVADYVTINLLQFDNDTLSYYYGAANAHSAGELRYTLAGATSVTNKALLIVVLDGDVAVAFFAPSVSIRRDAALSLAVDDFGTLPVRATILEDSTLEVNGSPIKLEWIGGAIEAPGGV